MRKESCEEMSDGWRAAAHSLNARRGRAVVTRARPEACRAARRRGDGPTCCRPRGGRSCPSSTSRSRSPQTAGPPALQEPRGRSLAAALMPADQVAEVGDCPHERLGDVEARALVQEGDSQELADDVLVGIDFRARPAAAGLRQLGLGNRHRPLDPLEDLRGPTCASRPGSCRGWRTARRRSSAGAWPARGPGRPAGCAAADGRGGPPRPRATATARGRRPFRGATTCAAWAGGARLRGRARRRFRRPCGRIRHAPIRAGPSRVSEARCFSQIASTYLTSSSAYWICALERGRWCQFVRVSLPCTRRSSTRLTRRRVSQGITAAAQALGHLHVDEFAGGPAGVVQAKADLRLAAVRDDRRFVVGHQLPPGRQDPCTSNGSTAAVRSAVANCSRQSWG